VAWDNAAHSLLERTLDDSGNRREVLPSAFLATDEILGTAQIVIGDLRIYDGAIGRTLAAYGDFAATERLLMALVRAGASRQEMHELIRERSMQAWQAVQVGAPAGVSTNPLPQLLSQDEQVKEYLAEDEVLALFDARGHIGDAPTRARAMAAEVLATLAESKTGDQA